MKIISPPRLDIKGIIFGQTVLSVLPSWSTALMIHDIKNSNMNKKIAKPIPDELVIYALGDRCLRVQKRSIEWEFYTTSKLHSVAYIFSTYS